MTYASDQFNQPERLSPLAQHLLRLRDTVLDNWTNAVQLTIPPARALYVPVLINTLPVFYDNLVQVLSSGYPRVAGDPGDNLPAAHGDERARLTQYSPRDLVREYQLFRNILIGACVADGIALQPNEHALVNEFIDSAIQEALTAYVARQNEFRERYLAALAHDIRNPLSNIGMAAQLILARQDSTGAHALAGRIVDNVAATDTLIREILDGATAYHGEQLRIELAQWDMLALARDVAGAVPGQVVEVEGESVLGYWSGTHVRRALQNLVGNAVKYGAAGDPPTMQVSATHGRVQVSVHNRGEPIAPERLHRILQPFQRATCGSEGWGLGLHFVRSVAECHAGSVTVDSSAARGTTVTLDLPVDPRPLVELAAGGAGPH